ncbi:LuxR C-terminal-related transcriptional regulator [Amycolatopsis sp. NPDC088138]|uniref:LuxR C-terminal-related transcriptional regulator n=1 Tax=Amycolatopsis sp. NPDC088138 TaxID=3363938 RepID=UPI003805BF7D
MSAGVEWTLAVQEAEAAVVSAPCRRDARCVLRALWVLVYAGELVAADAVTGVAAEVAARGDQHVADQFGLVRAYSALLCGGLDRAWELSRHVLEGTAGNDARLGATAVGVRVRLGRGAVDQARSMAWRAGLAAGAATDSRYRPLLFDALGALAMADGDFDAAERAFLACGRELADRGIVNPAILRWQGQAALAAHAAGRSEAARRTAHDAHAAAACWGSLRALGQATLVSATVAAGGPDPGLLADAVELLEPSWAPADLAEARLLLGSRHADAGEDGKARRELARARVQFEALRNVPRVDRIDATLRRLRTTERPALTDRELEAAQLAYADCTNKEIAARLFVSVRTVEYTLSRVYDKLGVPGRDGLADVIGDLPLRPVTVPGH